VIAPDWSVGCKVPCGPSPGIARMRSRREIFFFAGRARSDLRTNAGRSQVSGLQQRRARFYSSENAGAGWSCSKCIASSMNSSLRGSIYWRRRPSPCSSSIAASARTPRFATLLSWAYPLPHFWRLSGTAISMGDVEDFEPVEVVTETVRHLGGPTEVAALRLWLAEHFVRHGRR